MKIAIISDWFSDGVGYAENFLPGALGALGHEVHVITSDFQIYATSPEYDKVYRARLGDRRVSSGVSTREGFTLHRLPGRLRRSNIEIPQLADSLIHLSPDVVYCFEIACPTTLTAARYRHRVGCRLFCESRLHSSILQSGFIANIKRRLRSRLMRVPTIVKSIDTFYPTAPDVLRNITEHFGVPAERCRLSSLAVETRTFHPSASPDERQALRRRLGLSDTDLACIYTGRLTPEKGPLLLAQAVDQLQLQGHGDVRGVFVGEGDAEYVSKIASSKGCVVHPFVTPRELAGFYRSADIGVWPLQESTSQLDALACGLPLVVNDSVEDPIRLGEVGVTFKKGDIEDLASQILRLKNAQTRLVMGVRAVQRIVASCSWDALARSRVKDFEHALGKRE
jgi:glycosyltransferase involved in cell wall biosynthesis